MRFIRHPSDNTPRGHTRDAIKRMILTRGYRVGQKLPTYRDLAAHFGIAVRTVERVMRQLAEEEIVQLLHGKGAFVKKLPPGRGQLAEVGLVYPASRMLLVQTDYLNQILTGVIVQCELAHADLQIVAFREAGRPEPVPVPPRDIALKVDGVLLLGVLNDRYIAEFAREAIPLVLVDAQTQTAPISSICVDNTQAVDQVVDHLYQLGHRRIAYVDARSQDPLVHAGRVEWVDSGDTRERREAYLAAMTRLDLAGQQQIYRLDDDNPAALVGPMISSLRPERSAPTAILVYDAPWGAQLCEGLSAAGLRVPQEISIAGAVGAGAHRAGAHSLTCGVVDFRAMGEQAMQILQAQATGGSATEPMVHRLASALAVGTTTAAPPTS